MANVINATSTGNGGLVSTGDDSGILNIQTNEVTAITVDASQKVGIGTASPSALLHVSSTSAETLRFQSTSSAPYQSFYNSSANRAGYMEWNTSALKIDAESGAGSTMAFLTANTERMRIDSSGNLLVGTTSSDIAAVGIRLMNNNQLQASKSGDWSFRMGRRDSTGIVTEIYYNSSRVGDIATNGTGTSYNSASDYRLKENVEPMTGALAKVAALNPVTYRWKVDGSDGQGFIAHELAEVVPDAVRGAKDAVDADGNPVYQGIDTSFLVATLTAAIQELKAINDTQAETLTQQTEAINAQSAALAALTARIVALEGQ